MTNPELRPAPPHSTAPTRNGWPGASLPFGYNYVQALTRGPACAHPSSRAPQPYINKNATDKQMILLQRVMVVVYAIISGVIAIILLKLEVSLGWVYLFMGIVIGSAVFPVACALTWRKCSAMAAIVASLTTTPLAIMTWLITAAKLNDGELNLDTTGQDYPMLAGNLVALFWSAIVCVIMSYIWPQNYDWNELKAIPMQCEEGVGSTKALPEDEDSEEMMDKVIAWTWKTGGALTFILLIGWPVLTLPAKVFSEGYFTWWIILSVSEEPRQASSYYRGMGTCPIPKPVPLPALEAGRYLMCARLACACLGASHPCAAPPPTTQLRPPPTTSFPLLLGAQMVWGILASLTCIVLPVVESFDAVMAFFGKMRKPKESSETETKEMHQELPPVPATSS